MVISSYKDVVEMFKQNPDMVIHTSEKIKDSLVKSDTDEVWFCHEYFSYGVFKVWIEEVE